MVVFRTCMFKFRSQRNTPCWSNKICQGNIRSPSIMSPLDAVSLIARGFKAGSIVRLKMKNFLTYDECEFLTGPKLNIVIGPNGTGKSALTHAICLACCGSTSDVGKLNTFLTCQYVFWRLFERLLFRTFE